MGTPYFKSYNCFKIWEVERGGPKVSPNFPTSSNARRTGGKGVTIENLLNHMRKSVGYL